MKFERICTALIILAMIACVTVPVTARCSWGSCGTTTTQATVTEVVAVETTSCQDNGNQNTIFPFNPSGMAEMPRLPHTFGGCVLIGGAPAPAGTVVCVRGPNVLENCLILDGSGCFGRGTFDPKLTAQGTPVIGGMVNIPEGSDLSFYVNGEKARVCIGDTCRWSTQYHTGHYTEITLRVGVVCESTCG